MKDAFKCITPAVGDDSAATITKRGRLKAALLPPLQILLVFLLATALWLEGAHRIIVYVLGPQADFDTMVAIDVGGYVLMTSILLFVAVWSIACDLSVANHRVKESEYELILRLGHASEWRDDETCDHTVRVGDYTATLAKKLGWCDEDCHRIRLAAMLHDIGKIGIPDFVMAKNGDLSKKERELIQAHTLMGSDLLADSEVEQVQMAQRIAASHHEKWDGTGYPYGLEGEQIPFEGRLVALADVFDALTSRRRYKDAWPFYDAADEIKRLSGKHFDPKVVWAFEQSVAEFKDIHDRFHAAAKGVGINRAA